MNEGVVFVHIREPEEIQKLKQRIPDLYTMHISRPQAEVPANEVDQGTGNYQYDLCLENSGKSEADLEVLAKNFIKNNIPLISAFDCVIIF